MSFGKKLIFSPSEWGTKEFDRFNNFIKRGNVQCSRNFPRKLFGSATCGNGFIEVGEECDCGLASSCKHSCCDPKTCKLQANAKCGSRRCCNLLTCQPHAASFECRSVIDECDLPEHCDGQSEFCSTDYVKRDSDECTTDVCSKRHCLLVDDKRNIHENCSDSCNSRGICENIGYCQCSISNGKSR